MQANLYITTYNHSYRFKIYAVVSREGSIGMIMLFCIFKLYIHTILIEKRFTTIV
jgi:hypothetical protein